MSVADDRLAVLLLARDISARVAADQERRVAAIAFESQQGAWPLPMRERCALLKVNQGFTRISGYEPRELIGRTPEIPRLRPPPAGVHEVIRASLAASGAWQGEIWSRRKNGEIFPVVTVNAVRDAEGTVTHYVAGPPTSPSESSPKKRSATWPSTIPSHTFRIAGCSWTGSARPST